MNAEMKVTREQLTRYLTMLHFESVYSEGTSVDRVCAHVRARQSIQFDPIDIVGRNADLVLQSRIDGYRHEMLRQAIYDEHRLYDGYDKNLCIYPAGDFPYFGRRRKNIAGWFRDNETIRAYVPLVLAEIDRRGPLCSEDLDWNEKVRWPWGMSRVSRAVLESLWMDGTLCVARREGTKKYYDRFERCYDAELMRIPEPNPTDEEYFAWQAMRRTRSVGFLTGGASDALLCVDGMKQAERKSAFDGLCSEGKLLPVSADGLIEYIPAENDAIMEMAARRECEPKMRFIAPLDNLMWDRKLIRKLFDFEYTWEIYVPVEKRKYGYYVLPVMFGNTFVARFEAERFDGHTFCVKKWWWQEGWSEKDLPSGAKNDAMERFAAFLGAQSIEIRNEN